MTLIQLNECVETIKTYIGMTPNEAIGFYYEINENKGVLNAKLSINDKMGHLRHYEATIETKEHCLNFIKAFDSQFLPKEKQMCKE